MSGLPYGVQVMHGGHIVRAGQRGRTLPNGADADSTGLCGARGPVSRTPAASLRRREWCTACVAAFDAEGTGAAEPDVRVYRP